MRDAASAFMRDTLPHGCWQLRGQTRTACKHARGASSPGDQVRRFVGWARCATVTANPRISAQPHRIRISARFAKPLIRKQFRWTTFSAPVMASQLPRSNEERTAIAPVAPRREVHDENRDAQLTAPVGRYVHIRTARGPRAAGA